MRKSLAALAALLACLALVSPASAQRLGRGKSVIWVGVNGNRAELMSFVLSDGFFETGEAGLHLAYSYFLTDAWAAVVSGGVDVGGRDRRVDPLPRIKVTSNSWNMRFGFDRYAFIDDKVAIYAGPGLLFWRGNAEGDGAGDEFFDQEWPTVSVMALNGRLGMYARFAPHYALFGHIGQVIGRAHESAADAHQWVSHHEGSVGLAIDL